MRTAMALAALTFAASGQNPEFKISVTTNLVVVNVDVRDKDGRAIEGLKASDFRLLEDGKPQKITIFEYQRLEAEAPAPTLRQRPDATSAAQEKPVAKRDITPSTPGQIRYRDRRLMVFFFDMSSMSQPDQIRAQRAALKFIDQQLTPSDLVAVMAFTSKLSVLEDFTADRERLRTAVNSLRVGEASELAGVASEGETETSEDTGAAFTSDDSEFNIFNTDRKLGALESAAKMLASLPEKKALVYFSSGVGKTGMENQSQLRSTVNAAIRSNVSFYPIDARGLVASAPAGDASVRAPRGTSVFSGAAQTSRRESFNDQQETLTTLAADTGGKAFLDSNDLSLGIQQAQKDVASYYILGYYSTNASQDGKYRRIRVTIGGEPHAKLDYRSGYFGPKDFQRYDEGDKERQLEEALLLGDPVTDLPIALEVNYFRINPKQYFVPVAVKIPGSAVELARSGKGEEAELDFIGQVRDTKGRLTGAVRDMIKVRLKEAGGLSARNLGYDSGFTLAPGEYSLKFVARENITGKLGTFETKFAVPELSTETKWLRHSSVVWSNQREPLTAAVGKAESDRKLMALHPLIQDGQKLIPSITRVYRPSQAMYVYMEVYDPGLSGNSNEATPRISATLTLFRGKQKAFESQPLHVEQTAPKRAFVVPVQFQVPLSELKAGRYICQVSLIDELGKKFAFSRAPMVLLQQ